MFGLPLTMYVFMGVFGYSDAYSIEFFLTQSLGQETAFMIHHWLFNISKIVMGIGILLVIYGWKQIYQGKGKLVTTGLIQLHTPPPVPGILHDNPRNEHSMAYVHHASSVAGHRSPLLQTFKN